MHRILLVDDEENVLNALRRNLAPLHCELEAFSQPRRALARAGEVAFDVVISDYRMPGMDGVTLVKELKKLQPDLIAIMLSGFADLRAIMDAINEAEVYRYLTKPWDADKLNTTISQALEQRANGSKQAAHDPAQAVAQPRGALAALEAKYPGITQPGADWNPV